MTATFFLVLCAICVAGLLYAERNGRKRLIAAFKSAASFSFVLAAVAADPFAAPFGRAIFSGLLLCALGDILLIAASRKFFLAGMAAFAGGHAAYIAAFILGGAALSPAAIIAFAATAALGTGLLVWLWRDLGAFRGPVAAYALIIATMVAASAAHWSAAPSPERALLILAAAAFAISDVAVARDRFRKSAFLNRLWGLPLYYGAQAIFAISV